MDTVLGKRYYVFFLIRHFNRKIIQNGITTNTSREFIRQQIPVYVIHDRSPELYLNYKEYNILKKYIRYYNHFRPHQGIDQQVSCGYDQQVEGEVVSRPIRKTA